MMEIDFIQPKKTVGKLISIEVLDKIIAEIQNLRNCTCSYSDEVIDDVEDIIDKYKNGVSE